MLKRHFQTELLSEVHGEDDDRHRWILSYADFITLLFAFFVVMYSVSSVNDGKFRVLSQTMANVFQDPDVAAAVEQRLLEHAQQVADSSAAEPVSETLLTSDELAQLGDLNAEDLPTVLATMLAGWIEQDSIRVSASGDWTEIEFASDRAFDHDTLQLAPNAVAAVAAIADLARAVDMPVRVEGFTDNLPLANSMHSSNWERSAAAAASIADALVRAGVDAGQVSATAFGERHPLASNASEEGRERNRRVVVAIARHARVPQAAASMAASNDTRENLPSRILERVSELPGPESITL